MQYGEVTLTKDKTFSLDVKGLNGEQIQLLKKVLEIGLSYGRSEQVHKPLVNAYAKIKDGLLDSDEPSSNLENNTKPE